VAYEVLVTLADLGLVFVAALLLGLLLIGVPMWLADRWAHHGQPEESDNILTDD
jgi:hypothetical protein